MTDAEPFGSDPLDPLINVPVVDVDGLPVGRVRAVYPHYLVIEYDGQPPEAFRAPRRAVANVDAARIQLTVARDALDPMTPESWMRPGEGTAERTDRA